MKKRRNRSDSSAWMALPLYIFTIVFVVCPLIYMVALSFATPSRGFGVTWKFTLDNYRNILEPVYLNTFVESLKLAFTSTIVIALIGYPFGYFMARLPEHRKKKAQLLLSMPFWVNSLIRLYGWIIILQKKGLLNFVLMKLGIIEKPLSQLPYLGYLNYFIPVGTFLKIGAAWLAAIALFYLYSVLARWIKLIE